MTKTNKIAFLGKAGSHSDLACRAVFKDSQTTGCISFTEVFETVENGDADLALIPVDNTLAGRVADVHHLLPYSPLKIIGEHFQKIEHALIGVPGAAIGEITDVHSHVHALPQCREIISDHNLVKHVHADTASAAKYVADRQDKTQAAIASKLAAEIYGLAVIQDDIQDKDHNTTRFLVLSRDDDILPLEQGSAYITSFFFKVRNISAALYKCLGGFATNGVNLAKLESYVDENFTSAQFYCEVEGHVHQDNLKAAIDELKFFAEDIKVLGSYRAHSFRGW